MTDPAVGKTGEQVAISMVPNGGNRLVFVTTSGKYLGSVQFDATDAQSLGIIGNGFQQFTAQQAGSIQVANGANIPGLRTS